MASCIRNTRTKNCQNLIIGFQVTVKNVGDAFFGTQCTFVQLAVLTIVGSVVRHINKVILSPDLFSR